jgi:hypothetical protein
MPKKPRKTDTARIAEWVGDTADLYVSLYATTPDEKTLRWMYRSIWRSILDVYEQSMDRIKPASLEEIVRKVADRVATDIIMSRYPELPLDRVEYYASRIANVIYSDVWRYIVSYLTVRKGIEEIEYKEEKIRRPRYRTSHHMIHYVLRKIEEELSGEELGL